MVVALVFVGRSCPSYPRTFFYQGLDEAYPLYRYRPVSSLPSISKGGSN
jgi:hypothetical protein